MIKLDVEIKDEKFIYSYEIGTSKHHSTDKINPEYLSSFCDLLKYCHNISRHENKEIIDEFNARVWIEQNLEEAKKIIGNKK